jgi:hypothetical protein
MAHVFVDVFPLAFECAGELQSKHVNPQLLQPGLAGGADGDLLDTQGFEGAWGFTHEALFVKIEIQKI